MSHLHYPSMHCELEIRESLKHSDQLDLNFV